jgi:hypothetical protein
MPLMILRILEGADIGPIKQKRALPQKEPQAVYSLGTVVSSCLNFRLLYQAVGCQGMPPGWAFILLNTKRFRRSQYVFTPSGLRGLSGAHDEFLLAAIVQNLKTLALRIVAPPADQWRPAFA